MVACNEAANLPRALGSLGFADEILVVVDARSSDDTESIAREQGARVIVNPYAGDIEQKSFAIAQCRHDWVLVVDADEAVSRELRESIAALFAPGEPPAKLYELNRLTWHLGRWIRHGDFFPDWQPRLFDRTCGRYHGVNPHGGFRLDPGKGGSGRLAGELLHWSYRDLADQVSRIQDFSRIQADALARRGEHASLAQLVLRPPARFLRAYLLKQGFRDGMAGFVIAAATAFHVFLKYAKLWEIERVRGGAAGGEPAAGKPGRSAAAAGESARAR
jgi:glycosyltransferase involved in cell wall biosynthesis